MVRIAALQSQSRGLGVISLNPCMQIVQHLPIRQVKLSSSRCEFALPLIPCPSIRSTRAQLLLNRESGLGTREEQETSPRSFVSSRSAIIACQICYTTVSRVYGLIDNVMLTSASSPLASESGTSTEGTRPRSSWRRHCRTRRSSWVQRTV